VTDILDDRLIKAASAPDVRKPVAAILGDSFDAARGRIARRLDAGGEGVEVARLYSAAADDLLNALWRFTTVTLYPAANPSEAERLSLIAVGGYGRGVLAPHSDLDLLFLRPWKSIPRTEQVIEFMLYVLWDLGLKVGQSARSVDECLALANADMRVRTALLEARPLAGDERLAEDFITRFRTLVVKADPRPFIAAKLEERDVRHQKSGAVRYRVEPNVKDGKGGLRDLNTLFWIARSLAPDSPLGARVMDDLLTARERRTFEESFDFLWRVHAPLHLTDRGGAADGVARARRRAGGRALHAPLLPRRPRRRRPDPRHVGQAGGAPAEVDDEPVAADPRTQTQARGRGLYGGCGPSLGQGPRGVRRSARKTADAVPHGG